MSGGVRGNAHVIGTGKMARDLGLFLWSKGYAVTWLSRDPDRLGDLERYVSKKTRRLAALLDGEIGPATCRFALLDANDLPIADIVLESGAEDPDVKRAAIAAVAPCLRRETLVLSNSSSILPETISDRAVGMHFFYPVALCGYVELIFPAGCPARVRAGTEKLAGDLGLAYMVQGPREAFALNRLLLPLMAEVFRQLCLGHDIRALDDASRSPLLPKGQVAVMDDIGYDILAPAVARYLDRMPTDSARDYRHFRESLSSLTRAGYLGKKNKHPLLKSDPAVIRERLPRPGRSTPAVDLPELSRCLSHLFLNTFFSLADAAGHCTEPALAEALEAVFGAETSPRQLLEAEGERAVRDSLEAQFEATGLSYFRPGRLLLG